MAYETHWNSSADEMVTLQDGCRLAAPKVLGSGRPKPVAIIKGNQFRSLIKDGQKMVCSGQSPILLRYTDGPGRPQERLMSRKNSIPKLLGGKAKAKPVSNASDTAPDRAGKDPAPHDGIHELARALKDRCEFLQQKLDVITDQNDALQNTVSGLEREVTRIRDRIKYLGTLENKMAEIIERTNENSRIAISARNTCRKVNGDTEDSSTFMPIQK